MFDFIRNLFSKKPPALSDEEKQEEIKAIKEIWRRRVEKRWKFINDKKTHYYCAHITINGKHALKFLRDIVELQYWYKQCDSEFQIDQTVTEIIALYMYDEERGVLEIDDIMPHIGYQTKIGIPDSHIENESFERVF